MKHRLKKKLYLTKHDGYNNDIAILTRRPRAVLGRSGGQCNGRECNSPGCTVSLKATEGHFDTSREVLPVCRDGLKRVLGLDIKDQALYEVELTLKLVRKIEAPRK